MANVAKRYVLNNITFANAVVAVIKAHLESRGVALPEFDRLTDRGWLPLESARALAAGLGVPVEQLFIEQPATFDGGEVLLPDGAR